MTKSYDVLKSEISKSLNEQIQEVLGSGWGKFDTDTHDLVFRQSGYGSYHFDCSPPELENTQLLVIMEEGSIRFRLDIFRFKAMPLRRKTDFYISDFKEMADQADHTGLRFVDESKDILIHSALGKNQRIESGQTYRGAIVVDLRSKPDYPGVSDHGGPNRILGIFDLVPKQ